MALAEYAIDAAVSALEVFLRGEISDVRDVMREWPNPDYQFQYPALTILSAQHKITPCRHSIERQTEIETDENQNQVVWRNGYLEFLLQLDLWSNNKEQRNDLAEQIYQVLNPEMGRHSGLTLKMEAYHDTFCRYEIRSSRIDDAEESAQRSEWRYRFELQCHCDLLSSREQHIIKHIKLDESVVENTDGSDPIELNLEIP